ncbi:MAG: hypothetical protein AAFO96_12150 [Bacteroidota bacterium]
MSEENTELISILVEEGWRTLEDEAYDEAREIAEQLLSYEAEEGYALMGQVLLAEEGPAAAVAYMKEGIANYPESWRLLLEMGKIYAQTGEIETAMLVFDEAETKESAEKHWIDFYRALTYLNQEMPDVEEALNIFQGIDHEDLIIEAFRQQMMILTAIQRYDLVMELANEDLSVLPLPQTPEEEEAFSQILTYIAQAFWFDKDDEEEARKYLRAALDIERTNIEALDLLRSLNPVYSEESQFYSLLVEGEWVNPAEEEGEEDDVFAFVTNYAIVADSAEEAMTIVKDFEREEVRRDSLQVLDVEVEPNDEEDPKGIYFVTPFVFEGEEEALMDMMNLMIEEGEGMEGADNDNATGGEVQE